LTHNKEARQKSGWPGNFDFFISFFQKNWLAVDALDAWVIVKCYIYANKANPVDKISHYRKTEGILNSECVYKTKLS
jgi:hypothetical protein